MPDVNRPPFSSGDLEGICKALCEGGLTGTEIEHSIRQCRMNDPDPTIAKWKRLFNSFADYQNRTQRGNGVLGFISTALSPSRFVGDSDRLRSILESLNTVLAFHGLEFRDDGDFHKTTKVATLSEAERTAKQLKQKIIDRDLHLHLLKYCTAEIIQDNLFHAILEATKSVAQLIRDKTNLISDGAELVDEAFGGSSPVLRVNAYITETEKGEQRGFVNLSKGLFGTFRNPTAHAPKIEWQISEQDALDILSMVSYVLRRVERASIAVRA